MSPCFKHNYAHKIQTVRRRKKKGNLKASGSEWQTSNAQENMAWIISLKSQNSLIHFVAFLLQNTKPLNIKHPIYFSFPVLAFCIYFFRTWTVPFLRSSLEWFNRNRRIQSFKYYLWKWNFECFHSTYPCKVKCVSINKFKIRRLI